MMTARKKLYNARRATNKRERKHLREELYSVVRGAAIADPAHADDSSGTAERQRIARRVATQTRSFKPSSIDTDSRSVVAAISTPTPVRIYDYYSDKMVDEVLVPRGCKPAKPTMRMLNNHSTYEVINVLGTASEIMPSEKDVTARLTFSAASDVEPIFTRVAEGHVTDVSVRASYLEKDFVEIDPGKSRNIGGITYTATDVTMRVVKKWIPEEVSIVLEGADRNATIRSQSEVQKATHKKDVEDSSNRSRRQDTTTIGARSKMTINSRAMKYLVQRGLNPSATHATIESFVNRLSPLEQRRLVQRDKSASSFIVSSQDESRTSSRQASASLDRDDVDAASGSATAGAASQATTTVRSASEIAAQERDRIRSIRSLATSEIPESLVDEAIDKGFSPEQAGASFYEALRVKSQKSIPSHNAGRIGIQVKRGATLEALQGAMLLKHGHELDSEIFRGEVGQSMIGGECRWLARSARHLDSDRPIKDEDNAVMDDAHKYKGRSTVDVMRFALRAAGKRVPSDNREVIRAAMSSSILPRVFGPLINSQVLRGFEETPDSTLGWVPRQDVVDLRATELIMIEFANSFDEVTPGVEVNDLELVESGDSIRVRPFGKRFILDEDMALLDQVGVELIAPLKMGQMARSMAPDLVYATLLGNPNMADGAALFNTAGTRNNALSGTAFSATQLAAMEALMANQTITNSDGSVRALNLTAGYLVVGRNNRYLAKQVTGSATVTSASGDLNPYAGEYVVRADARINTGVRNPITKAVVAGSATTTFLAAAGGEHGLVIGQLAGTGGAPQVRSMPLNIPGRWGYGWDIKHYIGIGVAGFRGLVRNVS